MIQIYSRENTDYEMNGDRVLNPSMCEVSAELNGTWKLEISHPKDKEGRWKYIEEESVISVPTFMEDKQRFRIRELEKTDTEINATALPIFLDSADDCYLMDVRPTAKNGQEALNIMTAGTKYSGESNITTAATAYFVVRDLPGAINGEEEPTFIGRWGGEILYDNYKVIINESVGGDYGTEARYGKNMEGIQYNLDMSGVVTRLIPAGYNGYKISGNAPWVDSENIGKYAKKYIRTIKFDDVKMREDAQQDDEENGVIICDTQEEFDNALKAKCRQLFKGGIDLPAVSMEISVIDLSHTEEYKGYEELEKASLGDTISCRHQGLDITTKERVIKIVWDCCRNCAKTLTLGEPMYDYFSENSTAMDSLLNTISGVIGNDGSVMAGAIKGFLDAAKTQLRFQNTVAKRQNVRAILFEDLDPKSELFGALSLGTQGLQVAKRRTADNRDWDWTTALTANGLIANIIVAGILSDKKGLNYWDLDTGEFALSATGFKIDGETAEDYFKENWTQEEVFNKLTNDGNTMGIYLSEGKLYLNAKYMQIGKIASKNGKVFFDLDNNELACSKMISPETGSQLQTVVDVGYPQGKSPGDYTGSLMRIYPQGYPEKAVEVYVNSKGLGNLSAEGGIEVSSSGSNSDGKGGSSLSLDTSSARVSANFRRNSGSYGHAEIEFNTVVGTVGGSVKISPYLTVGGNMRVEGTCSVTGTKSRCAETENYGNRMLYCYEMPSPIFGDVGKGEIDEIGECYVDIGDIFSETVAENMEYQVFLQKEGEGDIWIHEKTPMYFIVKGNPGLKFAWEIKAKQRGYEYERLEMDNRYETEDNISGYEMDYEEEINQTIKEREDWLNETA